MTILTREPWCLRIDEIKKLTPYQVRHIYMVGTDEKTGLPVRRKAGFKTVYSYKELFYDTWRKRGLTDPEIDKRWVEYESSGSGSRTANANHRNQRTDRRFT